MAVMQAMIFCVFGMLSATSATDVQMHEFGDASHEASLLQVKRGNAPAQAQQSPVPSPVPDGKPSADESSNTPKPKAQTNEKASPPMVLTSSDSAVTSSSSTSAAFSQISDLADEFKDLREDDNAHIRQLLFNIQLREQLRARLSEADQQLANDNMRLAERTAHIAPDATNTAGAVQSQAATNASEADRVTALLLQSASDAKQHKIMTNEQIAAQALDRVKALVDDITALRERDDQEVQALGMNTKSRETLEARIATRREQLSKDAGNLLVDLGKIRVLAQAGQGQVDASGVAATSPAASFAQQPPQPQM